MPQWLEREVKLRFADARDARAAVLECGAAPYRPRRLQQDALLDTPDGMLRAQRSALRIRQESGGALLTFKGPVQASAMKVREEIETEAGNPDALLAVLERLGFTVWFRYEKYREEFVRDGVILAVDETPVGAFVEVEGTEAGVSACVTALGRSPADYVLDSYRGLFVAACAQRGVPPGDMLFDRV
jgi:adenylate cyclase class 2